MQKAIHQFIQDHWDGRSPLLLALSGGPDSLALYQLLQDFPLHVVHVDHGWRAESGQEAEALQELASSRGHPFHLCSIEPFGNDEENRARQARLQFLLNVWKKTEAQAVLFGHHHDDQAETILKRLFEGSGLPGLAGMQPIGIYEGMPLWRPLLSYSKQQIADYVQKEGLVAFDDPTNRDVKYLRARMRKELIPELERTFGKRISKSLGSIGNELHELITWMDEVTQPYLQESLMLKNASLSAPIIRHLLRRFLKKWQLTASRPVLERGVRAIENGDCNIKLPLIGGSWLHVHNYRVHIEFSGQIRYNEADTPPKKDSP